MTKTGRPRYRDYLQALWCLAFDWVEGLAPLYRHDRRGPLVCLGTQAQLVWFRAHNCRIYNWLAWEPESDDEPVGGPLARCWECPDGHQTLVSSMPLRGGECYCGERLVVSAVTS